MLWFSRVLTSHVADADGYLLHVCAIAGFDGVALSHVYDDIARYSRSLQPGWFPLAPLPLMFWLVDWPLWFVKVPQFIMVSVSFGTFALIARRLFASRSEAVAAAVLALCAWQFRAPHDPVIGTSLVTPWLAELTLLSLAGWLSYRDTGSRLWLAVGGVALLVAMFTDPLSWGFGFLLIGLMVLSPTRRRVAWPVAAIVTTAMVVSCSRGGLPFHWKHGGGYLSDVVAQLAAAIPTSYRAFGHLPIGQVPSLWHGIRFNDDRFVLIPPITTWGWFAIAACTLAVSFAVLSPRVAARASRREALLLGLGFWLIPALLLEPPGDLAKRSAAGSSVSRSVLAVFRRRRARDARRFSCSRLRGTVRAINAVFCHLGRVRPVLRQSAGGRRKPRAFRTPGRPAQSRTASSICRLFPLTRTGRYASSNA